MSSQSILPDRIKVKFTRTPIGTWTASSPDLQGFVLVSNSESSLRALIGEQIASVCRAQGFEVVTGPIGNLDKDTVQWSITIRNVIRASGPTKFGDNGRERSSPK